MFWASGALSDHVIVCPEIKQEQPQDRKTIFERLPLPVAKILSPVARQATTKGSKFCKTLYDWQCVKGEAQKSPLFWRFFWWFSQERLFCRNSTRKPLNLMKNSRFLQTPLVNPLVLTMHPICTLLIWNRHFRWVACQTTADAETVILRVNVGPWFEIFFCGAEKGLLDKERIPFY